MQQDWNVRLKGDKNWETITEFSDEEAASEFAKRVYKKEGELRRVYEIEVTDDPEAEAGLLYEVIPDVETIFPAHLKETPHSRHTDKPGRPQYAIDLVASELIPPGFAVLGDVIIKNINTDPE